MNFLKIPRKASSSSVKYPLGGLLSEYWEFLVRLDKEILEIRKLKAALDESDYFGSVSSFILVIYQRRRQDSRKHLRWRVLQQ